ncbi:hypothetical protein LZ30DRAFT_210985 [Colletotrichum cereale]|nr:hypothetical protein LZ30DRAFT_210985 [Colletotrichum cereale]
MCYPNGVYLSSLLCTSSPIPPPSHLYLVCYAVATFNCLDHLPSFDVVVVVIVAIYIKSIKKKRRKEEEEKRIRGVPFPEYGKPSPSRMDAHPLSDQPSQRPLNAMPRVREDRHIDPHQPLKNTSRHAEYALRHICKVPQSSPVVSISPPSHTFHAPRCHAQKQ